MITPQQALNRLLDNNELFYDEMTDLMRQIMQGEVAPEIIAAILIGLRIKVESVSEIAAAASVMREFASKVPLQDRSHLVDIVGTGGDNAHTFNISTTSMFVVAAAGAKVAKHGGRSVSSSSGSADIIEAMGASLELTPEHVGQCINQLGVGFMYAPNHHNSMRYVAPVRRALGVRTVFNILGPLTNPAGASNQVLGVFHLDLVGILSRVLQQMGSKHVLVVHGSDGLDEITLTGTTRVAELKNGTIMEYTSFQQRGVIKHHEFRAQWGKGTLSRHRCAQCSCCHICFRCRFFIRRGRRCSHISHRFRKSQKQTARIYPDDTTALCRTSKK